MCEIATGSPDDALDLMQDAACDFVRRYAARPAGEWGVLYYKIVQSQIGRAHV